MKLLDFMTKSQGFISIYKKMFYPFFKRAWKAFFIKENIESIYKAIGIWSYNPKKNIINLCKKAT